MEGKLGKLCSLPTLSCNFQFYSKEVLSIRTILLKEYICNKDTTTVQVLFLHSFSYLVLLVYLSSIATSFTYHSSLFFSVYVCLCICVSLIMSSSISVHFSHENIISLLSLHLPLFSFSGGDSGEKSSWNYDKGSMKVRILNYVEAWEKHKCSKECRHGSRFSVGVVCHLSLFFMWEFLADLIFCRFCSHNQCAFMYTKVLPLSLT